MFDTIAAKLLKWKLLGLPSFYKDTLMILLGPYYTPIDNSVHQV